MWTLGHVPTAFESVNIVVSIHWTLPSNFHFLHHSQTLHSLKTIAKYRNMDAHLCVLCQHACKYCYRSAEIILSIHWTLLSNFNFLCHPQILHCLKAMDKYRNIHALLCALCSHACTNPSRRLKHTLDPSKQISFSSSSTNSALFKSYYHLQKYACMSMCIAFACMHVYGASLIPP